MDEACALIRTEIDSLPTELDDIRRHIMQLEIEEAALKKEEDNLSRAHLAEVQKELAEQRDQFNSMKARWEAEKEAISKVTGLREEIERVNAQIEQAERNYDLNRAAELKYGELPKLKQALEKEEAVAEESRGENSLLRDKVTEEEIARIICRWTGIPVARLMEGEREKLLHLEDTLHQRVIGQDEAVRKVSEAILRSRAGIQDPNRPLGSFLFLGPTGVGKTELAKALAQALFDDEKNMIRIDMSEYMEKFSVSRLIGAPPGYVGYDEGGQLTEAVRRHPYCVILFDEVEKAHPDVFNILLQVLDDGRLTDNKGRTANFKNTIIIMTSNATRDQLRLTMRPEFLNRIDEIITFQPLTREQIADVVRLQIRKVQEMIEPQGFKLEVTPQAISYLAQEGYDPEFGARPVKRAIQQLVLNDLSKKLLAGEVTNERPIIVDEFGDGLVFRN